MVVAIPAAAVVVAVALALDPAARMEQPDTAAAQEASWQVVATHERAARQPTATGKVLRILVPWRGRLYIGYGDYGANTGPIAVASFDPATGTITEHLVSDTEAIYNYRPIRDRLYAPSADPRSRADYAVGEPWHDEQPVHATHAYDMVTLDGSDLWLVGSQGYRAAAWRSTDGGATWTASRFEPEHSGLKDDFARFYFAGVLGGRLYVQADDFHGSPHETSLVFDGTTWSEGPDMLGQGQGYRPVEFAGRLVYRGGESGGPLMSFDGRTAYELLGVRALSVDLFGGRLYALAMTNDRADCGLGGCEEVVRTIDLVNWERLEPPPPTGSRSFAVLDGRPYAGDSASRLHRLEGPPTWEPSARRWNARPSVSVTAPEAQAVLPEGAPVRVAADASDPDGAAGRPARVQLWVGTTRLAELADPPYEALWTRPVTGTHQAMARAIDADGAYAERSVRFSVGVPGTPGPTPAAPTQTPAVRTPSASATPTRTAAAPSASITPTAEPTRAAAPGPLLLPMAWR